MCRHMQSKHAATSQRQLTKPRPTPCMKKMGAVLGNMGASSPTEERPCSRDDTESQVSMLLLALFTGARWRTVGVLLLLHVV